METKHLDRVVIRFVGDSGDGMQLTGSEFAKAAAEAGNDISTFPDFPAEIRAPAGSLFGVSGFQLHFAANEIHTPGDAPDVLVAMNPAGLKTNLKDLVEHGTLIVNSGAFIEANLKKAGYQTNPLEDGSLDKYKVHSVDISQLTMSALEESDLSTKEKGRAKNFFALGLVFWMYGRETEGEVRRIYQQFAKKPGFGEANVKVFKAGYHYGETAEVFQTVYKVPPAQFKPGMYRNITGNEAIALGLVVGAELAGKKLFYAGYPITPASSVLHSLAKYKNFGTLTFQAEDEIAAMGAALGAAYGGSIAVTASSGPGIALKGEAIGLGVMTELPVVILNVQRGGPSTGLPTKTEQSDLFQALYGRNGESPIPVLAAKSPGDTFYCAIEAVKIATRYMVPVMLLSDGYIANGSEPWPLPNLATLPRFEVQHRTDPNGYFVYQRDERTLARAWVIPGTPGLEHRIGGIEKDSLTGNISYAPENHEKQTKTRQEKIDRIVQDIGELDLSGPDSGDVLLIGWGGTYGSLRQAQQQMATQGKKVSHAHLRWLSPLEPGLAKIIHNFKHVIVAELNMGQLRSVLRDKFLIDCQGLNKIQGMPFKVREVIAAVDQQLEALPAELFVFLSHPGERVMSEAVKLKLSKKDLESDQDVRWCPGCGDYAILATVQRTLAQLSVKRENTVFISGIGCSSRFPYYMNTYGFHTIHGRAPTIASGLKITRPELDVWVITGDGDGLSIGGNHMVHVLRRNMDLKIILFNNQIYGLTKGQYSPTSAVGTRAPSTPTGSIDHPLNPISLALGAGATFIARAADTDAKGMAKILEQAYAHKGAVFIEMLQNCPVFNDGVWEGVKDDPAGKQIALVDGKPLTFANGTKGIRLNPSTLEPEIVDVKDGDTSGLLVHNERGSAVYSHVLAQLVQPNFPMPMGILHREDKPTYDQLANAQVNEAIEKQGTGDLTKLLYSGMTWEVGADGTHH